ncbi:MAG: hypothetical protein M3Z25_03320 [Actinomycetota bacterium]|nr:hypothetical protein [Actinomycetota bacterium]
MNPEGQSGPATIGARLDRLPWSARHTTILLALGAGWMFDSFEVQLFSSAVGPLGDHFGASVLARTAVLAVWLSGILIGALLGGAAHRPLRAPTAARSTRYSLITNSGTTATPRPIIGRTEQSDPSLCVERQGNDCVLASWRRS